MKTTIHTTPDGKYEYGWIASPKDMIGTIKPFRQCWHVQYLYDGTSEFFATRREVFQFIAMFYNICDAAYPAWLAKELK